jgi:ribosomal protein S18 acetylase RimI-like enzyme
MTVSILEEKDYDEVCLVSAAFRVESKFMGPVQKDPAFEMKRVTRYTTNDNLYIVGKVQGKIVGLIRFHNEDKITGEFGLGVLKDYQGKGYSKRLIHFLMSTLRRKGYESLKLTVNGGNATAIKLYESLNFIRQDKETEDEMQMIYYFGE